ncbi:AAA domain-containing protein [Leekyejoonella antrihumi]|nr:AAA domain-containing protein [Leekyejoonella antrihumi]
MSDPAHRATRLFRFLARAQEMKTKRVRTFDSYTQIGSVQWLADAPLHEAVFVARRDEAQDDEADEQLVMSIERLGKQPAPEIPQELTDWVTPAPSSTSEPRLRQVQAGWALESEVPTKASLEDRPDIQAAFDQWMTLWRQWAADERRNAPVRAYYEQLFRIHAQTVGRGEELEFVLGLGLLSWRPSDQPDVRRHVFVCPLKALIDDQSGRIEVSIDDTARGLNFENDMLDPGALPDRHTLEKVQEQASEYADHALAREPFRALASTLVNHLDAAGRYFDDEQRRPPAEDAVIAWSPALILRPRRDIGLVRVLDAISDQIESSGAVPEGIMPLVDPDHVPAVSTNPRPGAVLDIDGDVFSPLPLNDVQRQILERVSRHAQTLVQGPPGTGKTHTAAALLSHLLAQGQRVLVTAHTDRALSEVRGKLPDKIKPLAVSVIGSSHDDMADLKVAVDTISRESSDFDHAAADHEITKALTEVDELRGARQELGHQLLHAREIETETHHHLGYNGTLAQIAQRFDDEVNQFSWIGGLVEFDGQVPAALSDREATYWLELLRSTEIADDEHEARMRLVPQDQVPDPERFSQSVAARAEASAAVQQFNHLARHPALTPVQRLSPTARSEVTKELVSLMNEVDALPLQRTQWMEKAVHDVRSGLSRVWVDRHEAIANRLRGVTLAITFLGVGTTVRCPEDAGPLLAMAETLKAHLATHGPLKLHPDGTPKIGVFAPSVVKKVDLLFEQVKVNGLPPTDARALELFRAHTDASRLLNELDHAWPVSVTIPDEDTLNARASWHQGQFEQLARVLNLGQDLDRVGVRFAELGVPHPDWADRDAIQQYTELVDAANAHDHKAEATGSLRAEIQHVVDTTAWDDASPVVHDLSAAAQSADSEAYARAYARHQKLHEVKALVQQRDQLTARLKSTAPALAAAVIDTAPDIAWSERFSELGAAWTWGNIGAWILARDDVDSNVAQAKITVIEQRLREKAELIAALRAWKHAVGEDRITGSARANLTQYSQLVRRLGKGTGKYAALQRTGIRDAMDRSRSAVPVWIMPIYRIAEQFDVTENMFDVVLVDEASQAGVEAAFLQFLAPKIVVIGDDKQVSPSAVGIDQGELRQLAARYLYDNEHRDSWQDPKRSLFDEAVMRFGSRLTLREHRRCVPEIIGFSNRIAYEPDGVRLLPVRQFGADRLEPIRQVFLADAYQEGQSRNRINRGEARAIVDQIKACCEDPAYDDKSIGVISLLGRTQAQLIETLLLQEIPNEEWVARDLRAGDAPDFQGSERDVIFLSMVASIEPGSRLAPLTRDEYLQRYNVAASRARDQMWLYHSVSLDELPNSEDLRHQLIAYVEEVASAGRFWADESPAVSEVDRVDPFDSLFEQRVYNRIVHRGYVVEPQFDANGYKIDLVVVGAQGRLAVECDGDHWHGPDAYLQDLARQRDLERCGWTFFRVRESSFYVDEVSALAGLWEQLGQLDIRPGGWVTESGSLEFEESLGLKDPDEIEEPDDAPLDAAGPLRARPTSTVIPDPAESSRSSLNSLGSPPPALADDEEQSADSTTTGLAPYVQFDGATVPLDSASRQEIAEGLVEIVRAEGPILGERLRHVYVKASGGERVGRNIAGQLNRAIWAAAQRGDLLSDNPFKEAGQASRSFRLPGQDASAVRELGPRTLAQIPPLELASVLQMLSNGVSDMSQTELYRRALALLGRKSLTEASRAQLDRALTLTSDGQRMSHEQSTGLNSGDE